MRKCSRPNKVFSEGYILLEAMVSIIILAIFLGSLSGLFSSMVKNTLRTEEAFTEYLAEYNSYIDTQKILYHEE